MALPVTDLRSDTVTRPTPEMRRAMASAEVGDDVYGEDPTVNRLEARAAEIFGREAAIFVPSGTMGNTIAVKIHTRPGQEVICEQRGHIFNYEMAMLAHFSGCVARTIAAEDGILTWAAIGRWIAPKIYYRAQTGLVSLENTHNMAGGTVYPQDIFDDVCDQAHAAGLPVHLDGARIFNAATVLGQPVATVTKKADSVMFCLSKGLGAPVGAVLAGTQAFIEEAWVFKQRLGGAMRQAGIIAAAGIHALEHHVARLAEDHERARNLARGLSELPGVAVDAARVDTNIVIFDVRGTGITGEEFGRRTLERFGVRFSVLGPTLVRAVTHLDLPPDAVERALSAARAALRG